MSESNFEYLKLNFFTINYFLESERAEQYYASGDYSAELTSCRKLSENLIIDVLDQSFLKPKLTFSENLSLIKKEGILPVGDPVLDDLYTIKQNGNQAAHELDGQKKYSKELGLAILKDLSHVLFWFATKYADYPRTDYSFVEPVLKLKYQTFERRLIYSMTGDNESGKWPAYEGREKVGEATIENPEANLEKNSPALRKAADKRIKAYMGTATVPYKLEWAEYAWSPKTKSFFSDHDVHKVLDNSNIQRDQRLVENGGHEWFITNVDTVKSAIAAVKEGKPAIGVMSSNVTKPKIELRPEQKEAVSMAKKVFKNSTKVLWNAKMRFGKTLSALKLIKDERYQRVLIMTHRPVVKDSWYQDFQKIGMAQVGYRYGSKTKGMTLEQLEDDGHPYIYFASIQDLRGSTTFGGKISDKNQIFRKIDWSLVIIDEAHEGTQTDLAQKVIDGVTKEYTRVLELSGTPFNLLDQYNDDQVYTWDYMMEQKAKLRWSMDHPNQKNPYQALPKVSMYTFEMKKRFNQIEFEDPVTKAFNFHEFFRVNDYGRFTYEANVKQFLNNISSPSSNNNYPFSTDHFRNELRHTLWLMPSVRSAKAMEKLLRQHPVFGVGYKIVDVVDNDDDNDISTFANKTDLDRVRNAIGDFPGQTRTITLTVRKLTTGVNIPEWTGIIFLSNTNSATQYLQAAFRAQTPFKDKELGVKRNCYIFDFAPDRALTVMAESANLNTSAGKLRTIEQKSKLGEMLNFLPIIGEQGQGMKPYRVDSLLTRLKKVYAEKAVRSGFDDDSLYNDELLKLSDSDVNDFNDLKAIVGTTKAEKKAVTIDVNQQGLTDEEYNRAEKAKHKKQKQRTPEEEELIQREKENKKVQKKMISILRSISIRIPMMIYGMDIDIDEDVDVATFVDRIDEESWLEFMPKGVTKEQFRKFSKYYDSEIFIEAGRIIRRRVKKLDQLEPIERTQKIAEIFGTFKNPDKETVLTPWRVVNMQLGKTVGGFSYFDEEYRYTSQDGKTTNHWIETGLTSSIFKRDTKILEINAKTGLYPLYAATSLFYQAQQQLNDDGAGRFTAEDEEDAWENILKQNIFIVAKTPMAKTITQRTLTGFKGYKTNVTYVDNIVNIARKSIEQGVKKIEEANDEMKFDVVIGNPPYQEQTAGASSSDKPIYHLFMDMAYKLAPKAILITPGRFLFNAGATPNSWNQKMLNDTHLKVISYEQNSDKIFPRTDIKGGVVITLRDSTRDFGSIGTFTIYDELKTILEKVEPSLKLHDLSQQIYTQNKLNLDIVYKDFPDAEKMISSNGQDRRMESNIFTKLPIFTTKKASENDIKILGLIENKRLFRYIDKKYVDLQHPNLNKYKVA